MRYSMAACKLFVGGFGFRAPAGAHTLAKPMHKCAFQEICMAVTFPFWHTMRQLFLQGCCAVSFFGNSAYIVTMDNLPKGISLLTENEKKNLEKIRAKMAQMQEREKRILTRDKARQRKERTRRLIQIGAIAEKYLDCKDIEPADFERLIKNKLGGG